MEAFRARKPEVMVPERMEELTELLSQAINESCDLRDIEETYEIEASSFSLSCTLEGAFLEIRNMDTRGNSGLGRVVIAAIHEFADTYHLEVTAGMVKDEARGFWEKMGYVEGEGPGEFFRVM